MRWRRSRKGVRWGLALPLLASSFPRAIAGVEEEWKVGLARVVITPERPVRLAGYASRTRPFEGVLDPIHAKALAFEDSRGARAVLITACLIGFPASVAEPIADGIRARTGLPRERVLLAASHTHTAPALSRDTDLEEDGGTAEYTQRLKDLVVDLATRSLRELRPARLSHGVGVAPFVMNRREFTPSGVRLGVNPRGLADRSVPVLRVEGPGGELIAVLFGCACHNTTLGEHLQVSGDYAGVAQLVVETRHPAAQAMFICGLGGDANPYPRGTVDLARAHGQILGEEVCRVLALGTGLRPVRGPLRTVWERVDLPLEEPPSRERLKELAASSGVEQWSASRMLAVLDRGGTLPRHYSAPFAVWQFGEDLTLVALPGEVVSDYVPLLEVALGRHGLWLAAYANDVFGYVPSRKVLREGGYETRGLYAGGLGRFAPEVEEAVVETAFRLARRAGRLP